MRGFWRVFPLFFSALPALALGFGLVRAFAPPPGSPLAPVAPGGLAVHPAPGKSLVLALGDSLTRGRGDEGGEGYVGDVAAEMRRRRPGLTVENLAVDGLESEGLAEMLAHPNPQALAGAAGLILLSIGGNDLSHAVGGSAAGAGLAGAKQRLEANLDGILGLLRRLNPSAPIVLLTLYNPAGSAGGLSELGSEVIVDWNAAIERIAVRHGARAVPLRDLFDGHPERLSADHFHPNAAGYRLIGNRVLEQL